MIIDSRRSSPILALCGVATWPQEEKHLSTEVEVGAIDRSELRIIVSFSEMNPSCINWSTSASTDVSFESRDKKSIFDCSIALSD